MNRLKRVYVFLVGLCLIIGLSACANSTDEKDAKFNEAWSKVGATASVDEGRAEAKATCLDLDSGTPFIKIFTGLVNEYGADDAGYILGGAVFVYCPEHKDEVMNNLDTLSSLGG